METQAEQGQGVERSVKQIAYDAVVKKEMDKALRLPATARFIDAICRYQDGRGPSQV